MWTHWAISLSSQCSTTGVTKAVVCVILSVGWLEREIAQWVNPMKGRSDDPSHHERTLLPRSYISLLHHPIDRDTLLFLQYLSREKYLTFGKGRSGQRVLRAHSEQGVVAHACHGHRCLPSPAPLSGTGKKGGNEGETACTYKGVPAVRPG